MTVASTQFIETPDRTTHKKTGASVHDRAYENVIYLLSLRAISLDPFLRFSCFLMRVHNLALIEARLFASCLAGLTTDASCPIETAPHPLPYSLDQDRCAGLIFGLLET
jgi:hypothetical protein